MRPLGIGSRGRFLFVTTGGKKNGFLLTEVSSKLKHSHQGPILGDYLLFVSNFSKAKKGSVFL